MKRRIKREPQKGSAAAVFCLILLTVSAAVIWLYLVPSALGSRGDGKLGFYKSERTTAAETPAPLSEPSHTAPAEVNAPNNDGEDWALYVIGKRDPLPENYAPETAQVTGSAVLDSRCADYAAQMLKDADGQGVGLFVTSAYRSVQKQSENMESYINTLISQGFSREEARAQAEREIAPSGCSEHNAGLALDIVSVGWWNDHSGFDESFEETPQFDWLIENAHKYGFILSYPKGKEDITGFVYEPWHFRFVGLGHAEKIHRVYEDTGEFLTVNEYIEQYAK